MCVCVGKSIAERPVCLFVVVFPPDTENVKHSIRRQSTVSVKDKDTELLHARMRQLKCNWIYCLKQD